MGIAAYLCSVVALGHKGVIRCSHYLSPLRETLLCFLFFLFFFFLFLIFLIFFDDMIYLTYIVQGHRGLFF